MSEAEAHMTMVLALGRLFRMGARPTKPGDDEAYYQLRSAALDAADVLNVGTVDNRTNWARDRLKGAKGD